MRKGSHHTTEVRRKISKAREGQVLSGETKRKMSEAKKGSRHTIGARRKMSEAQKGKKLSEETRRKISRTKKGKPAWNKGIPHSEEAKKKMSEAKKDKTYEELGRDSSPLKGRPLSPEHIQKIVARACERPTSYEKKFMDSIEERRFPFRYVGDGSLIVGYVNPDFVDTLGLDPPLVVEVYERYWHPDDYEDTRHKQLCVPRRNVLFLDGNDLNREDWKKHCASRVRWFLLAREGGL